jgi:hypothetical protein
VGQRSLKGWAGAGMKYIYIVVNRKRAPEPGEIGARETKKQNKKNVGTGVFQ